jgi:hypothetical protein
VIHLKGSRVIPEYIRLSEKQSPGNALVKFNRGILTWDVGHDLVFESTTFEFTEMEEIKIDKIFANKTTILEEELKHFHFGDFAESVTNSGVYDFRGYVVNNSKNINITTVFDGENTQDSCVITVNNTTSDVTQTSLMLDSVKISHFGRATEQIAGITIKGKGKKTIVNSSFAHFKSKGVEVIDTDFLAFSKNFIFDCYQYGVWVRESFNVLLKDNIIINIKKMNNSTSAIGLFLDFYTNELKSRNLLSYFNKISSVDGVGIVSPGEPCEGPPNIITNFKGNVARNCEIGWFGYFKKPGQGDIACVKYSNFIGFKNKFASFVNLRGLPKVVLNGMRFFESKFGAVINVKGVRVNGEQFFDFGNRGRIEILNSSFYSKILRSCPECFTGDYCDTNGLLIASSDKIKELMSPEVKKMRSTLFNIINDPIELPMFDIIITDSSFENFNYNFTCVNNNFGVVYDLPPNSVVHTTIQKSRFLLSDRPSWIYFNDHPELMCKGNVCEVKNDSFFYENEIASSNERVFSFRKVHSIDQNNGDSDCSNIELSGGLHCMFKFARILMYQETREENNLNDTFTKVTLPPNIEYLVVPKKLLSLVDFNFGLLFVPINSSQPAIVDFENQKGNLFLKLLDENLINQRVVIRIKSGNMYNISVDGDAISLKVYSYENQILQNLIQCGDHIISDLSDHMYLMLDSECVVKVSLSLTISFIFKFEKSLNDIRTIINRTLSELKTQLNINQGVEVVSFDQLTHELEVTISEEIIQNLVSKETATEGSDEDKMLSILNSLTFTQKVELIRKEKENSITPITPESKPEPVESGNNKIDNNNKIMIIIIVVGSLFFATGAGLGIYKCIKFIKSM